MKQLIARAAIAAAFFLMIANAANAQHRWGWKQMPGPSGGEVRCIATDREGVSYLGTLIGGVYRWDLDARAWRNATENIVPRGSVAALAIDSSNNVYASIGGALYRSSDRGNTWTALPAAGTGILTITVDDSGSVYVGGRGAGAKRSDDGGVTWNALPVGDLAVSNILALPRGALWVVGTKNRLWHSYDRGATWSWVLPPDSNSYAVAMQRGWGAEIYAVCTRGAFSSTDGGTTWTRRTAPGETGINGFLLHPGGRMLASTGLGMSVSTDAGASWNSCRTSACPSEVLCIDLLPDGAVLIGTRREGVFLSPDAGEAWYFFNEGFVNSVVRSMLVTREGSILAGTNRRLARSIDGGLTWSTYMRGLPEAVVTYQTLHQDARGTLYLGTDFSRAYRSSDDGVNWSPVVTAEQDYSYVFSFLSLPGGDLLMGGDRGHVFLSADSGASWTGIGGGLPQSNVNALLHTSGGILAATDSGLFLLPPPASAWRRASDSLLGHIAITALALDSSGHWLLGSKAGLYRSIDEDRVFERLDAAELTGEIAGLYVRRDGELVAGTINGVWTSTDNGNTWTQQRALMMDRLVTSFAEDNSETLFAGSVGGGVFAQAGPTLSAGRVEARPSGFRILAVSPHPAQSASIVEVAVPENGYVDLNISDALGRAALPAQRVRATAGTVRIPLDVTALPAGVYLLRAIFLADHGTRMEQCRPMIVR